MNQNQNQRYEVLMHFPGYEARMGFPGYNQRYNAREGITGVEYAAKPRQQTMFASPDFIIAVLYRKVKIEKVGNRS